MKPILVFLVALLIVVALSLLGGCKKKGGSVSYVWSGIPSLETVSCAWQRMDNDYTTPVFGQCVADGVAYQCVDDREGHVDCARITPLPASVTAVPAEQP